ncbi:hypothetical protein [Photobacterium leiognathi]|uniref:hypothetical protein n=1 Tax=Photobacterium leiognathi TaxID=553611 RepID=UPI002739DDC4|nr:hypothetical protein [Photobacterium leiognathi]
MNNSLTFIVAGGLFVTAMALGITTNESMAQQDMYSDKLTQYVNKDIFNAPKWKEIVASGVTKIECGTEDTGARYCLSNNGFAQFNYPLFDNKGEVGNKALIITNEPQNDQSDQSDQPLMKVYFNSKGNLLSVKQVEKALDDIINTVLVNIDNSKTFK